MRLAEVLQMPEHLSMMASLTRRDVLQAPHEREPDAPPPYGRPAWEAQRVLSSLISLKENATRNIRVTELADRLNEHVFHECVVSQRHRYEATPISEAIMPARGTLVLTTKGVDVTTASFRAGYENTSQINPEYKRFFGAAPPLQEVQELRAAH